MPASLTRPTHAPYLAPDETVVLFDGVCKLCNGWAKFLIRYDGDHRVRLATVQSKEGQALLAWAGLPVDTFGTMAVMSPKRQSVDYLLRLFGGEDRERDNRQKPATHGATFLTAQADPVIDVFCHAARKRVVI